MRILFVTAVAMAALAVPSIASAAEGEVTASLALGDLHSCAVRTDGTVACWGRDVEGQRSAPSGTFTAVSADGVGSTSCGLRTDGTLTCWGQNDYGQTAAPTGTFTALALGRYHGCALRTDGTPACWGRSDIGQTSPATGTFTTLASGRFHTCGVRPDGTVACWGSNVQGQRNVPSGTFTAVAAGDWHSCGLRTDGTVTCWGANDYDQLAAPAGTFVALSAGAYHTCALRADRTVACWGRSTYGQTSPPTGTFTAVDGGYGHSCGVRTSGAMACWGRNVYGEGAAPGGSFSRRAVSAGERNTCGVQLDGTLRCWGDDGVGQSSPPAGAFTAVSAGGAHSCGVHADGTAACWGSDSNGQTSQTPAGSFVAVSAGGAHSCGLHPDGTLSCWGGNGFGQRAAPAGTFTAVGAGGRHTCAVRTDGTLECWGADDHDQSSPPAGSFKAISVTRFRNCALRADGVTLCWGEGSGGDPASAFTAVSAGGAHSCGLEADGTLECWGANDSGQASPPSGTFTSVSAAESHSCGVRTDQTVACWGLGSFGRLGAAPAAPSPTPPSNVFARLPYSHDFTSSTGAPAGTFAVTAGSLPPGLTLSAGGQLSGTPTTGGTFAFTVTAANGFFGPDASTPFSITVTNDTTPPAITPSVTGTLGDDGWYTGDVHVTWAVAEADSPSTLDTHGCGAADVTSDTDGTTFTCEASSVGGTASKSVTIKRDTTAPNVSCESPDDQWHGTDVSVACTADDAVAGLADGGDAAFSLSTDVPTGSETATAATGSRTITDRAGNATSADPVEGIKVDKLAPEIAIQAPTARSYAHNQAVAAQYGCEDGGAGVDACQGPVASGGKIDTTSAGTRTFTVTAADEVGNTSRRSVTYTVASAPRPAAPAPAPTVMRVRAARLSVFGRSGSTVRCSMSTGGLDSCTVRVLAGRRVIATGSAAAGAPRPDLAVRVRLTRAGKALLARKLGGVRVRVQANSGAREATARTRAILRVERFTTPAGSWKPGEAALSHRGERFVRSLRHKLIAVSALRCDGYAARIELLATAMRVSRDRAAALCADLGIDAPTTVKGHGDAQPIATNRTESGRAANRRVEVTVRH